jgi:tripartite-type tricarboxylate transporter receptor subunit TctC
MRLDALGLRDVGAAMFLLAEVVAMPQFALAQTYPTRPELPDVPTLKELGFDGAAIYNWIGVFAPAATPRPIIDRLNAEINDALRDPEIARLLGDTGLEIVASTPAELDRFVVSEIDGWRKFTQEFNIRFE